MKAPTPPLAALREVSKRFGPLLAVDALSFDVVAGEVHALIGGNGAGKTTAMKMLAGLERPDDGEVIVDGQPAAFHSRRDAIRAGIGFIQQEFSLVDTLTCADNLLLGHPEHGFVLDRRGAVRTLRELGSRFGITLDPERLVGTLSMGERQQLEILVALSWGGRVVILDEPTSATGETGLRFLRTALVLLRERRIGVVYISHKLPEVIELADRITVLRRGRMVWEGPAAGADTGELARAMVGDTALLVSGRARHPPGDVVLRLDGAGIPWSESGRSLHDLTLEVRRHEILGIAGVAGNGQRELARLAAGLVEPHVGTVMRPRRAGYVAEDRGRDSLALDLSPMDNAIVHAHRRPPITRHGLLRSAAVRAFTLDLLKRFSIDHTVIERTPQARLLSGGNQQRLVLGRELAESTDLLVLHNPARGLDIAATAELFRQLDAFSVAGGAALLISPDLDELLEWADAIQVLVDGRLSERLPASRDAVARIAERMAGIA
jgi:simple sugar transport system ATP-binding protein